MTHATDIAAKAFSADAPRFLALEFADPPATALVEARRADHSSFEATRIPTHADVTVLAANGGSAQLRDLDLKALQPAGLLDVIAGALPTAHKTGLRGDDAELLGQMAVNAATARHLARNLEGL